ncbi:MAG: discoidin domain-containing protein [Deltaproteobacteria bacterium]
MRRLIEWFWRGAALARARADVPPTGLEAAELLRRARLSAEAGRRALEPSPPFDDGPADAVACEQYGHAIDWLLRAKRGAARAGVERGALLASIDLELLEQAGIAPAELSDPQGLWRERSYVELAELTLAQQRELARRSQRCAEALLEAANAPLRAPNDVRYQRALRVGGLGLVLVALSVGSRPLAQALETDLARGKAWRASSNGHAACTSPAQDCGSSFFFHTNAERQPWVEIDLGEPLSFSQLRVRNRSDCCTERAVPLVVEVSDDAQTFRPVAEHTANFRTWTPRFERVRARYVRLRASRSTTLHLRRVFVLP